MQRRFRYLSVMGTMGSGKTTASRLIAQRLGYHLVEENFGENAFLPRFYKRMNRWAFHSQTFFLMEKISQLMEIRSDRMNHPIIQDTPIQQDVFSYAKAQHVLGNIDDAEWKLYTKIFHAFESYLPKPDLIIYLETSIPVVMKRIASRGRGFEKAIPRKYLLLLQTLNDEWATSVSNRKMLRIQTDNLNIVTSKAAQQEFLEALDRRLGTAVRP